MGMYTTVECCDLELRKGVKLKEFETFLKQKIEGDYNTEITIDTDGHISYDFERKVISYWYPETVRWFMRLALWVEGELVLRFENDSEGATIHFKDSIATFEIGQMKYINYTAENLLKDR